MLLPVTKDTRQPCYLSQSTGDGISTFEAMDSLSGCRLAALSLEESARVPSALHTVDGRTASQWLRCAVFRLEAQAKIQEVLHPQERFEPYRMQCLSALALLNDLRYFDPDSKRLHVAAPVLNPAPPLLPGEEDYRGWLRSSLVMALIAEGPDGKFKTSTSRKILSHLATSKLAHMLAEVRQGGTAAARA